MSANPLPAAPMAHSANAAPLERASDPSMEEILASIRRIIADEQEALQPAQPVPAPVAPPPVPENDFDQWLHHTASGAAVAPVAAPVAAPSPVMMQPAAPVEAIAPLAAPHAAPPQLSIVNPPSAPAPAPQAIAAPAPDPLEQPLETPQNQPPHTQSLHAQSPQALAEPLLSPPAGASVQSSFQALARTMFMQNSAMVDEAVRDMLRPMLKQWLDDNLPVIVEKLVRAEIERVARGGR